jgi:hypothetical protein
MEFEDKTLTVTVTNHDPNLVRVKMDYDGTVTEDTKTIEHATKFMETITNLLTSRKNNKYDLSKLQVGEEKTVSSTRPQLVRAACSRHGQRNNRRYSTSTCTNNIVKIKRLR